MHRSLLQKLGALVALGLFVGIAPAASAAGLLGERYVAAGYDRTYTETSAYDEGSGVTLFYNHPLSDNVDLGLSYRMSTFEAARDGLEDLTDQRFQVLATAFGPPELDRIWVRVGVGIGEVDDGFDSETGVSWVGMIGTEYTLGENGVLQPYAGWSDVVSAGASPRFIYGLQTVFDIGSNVSANVRIEGDDNYNVTLSLGALYRF